MDELVRTIERSPVLDRRVGGPVGVEGRGRRHPPALRRGCLRGCPREVASRSPPIWWTAPISAAGPRSARPSAASWPHRLGLVDTAAPIIGEFILDLPGVQSTTGPDGREPVTPGALRPARPHRPALPHRGQPGRGLPALRHRGELARVRAVHRRRRRRRHGRRRIARAGRLRPGRAAHPGVGARGAGSGVRRLRASTCRPASPGSGPVSAPWHSWSAPWPCSRRSPRRGSPSWPASSAPCSPCWAACRPWFAPASPPRPSAASG